MIKKRLSKEEQRRLQRKRKRNRILVILIELVLLALLGAAAYTMFVVGNTDFYMIW